MDKEEEPDPFDGEEEVPGESEEEVQREGGVFAECSYVSEGCTKTKIPIDLLEIHEKFECEYRLVKCTN